MDGRRSCSILPGGSPSHAFEDLSPSGLRKPLRVPPYIQLRQGGLGLYLGRHPLSRSNGNSAGFVYQTERGIPQPRWSSPGYKKTLSAAVGFSTGAELLVSSFFQKKFRYYIPQTHSHTSSFLTPPSHSFAQGLLFPQRGGASPDGIYVHTIVVMAHESATRGLASPPLAQTSHRQMGL